MSKIANVHNPKKVSVPVDLTGNLQEATLLPPRASQEFVIPSEEAETRLKAAGLILNFK